MWRTSRSSSLNSVPHPVTSQTWSTTPSTFPPSASRFPKSSFDAGGWSWSVWQSQENIEQLELQTSWQDRTDWWTTHGASVWLSSSEDVYVIKEKSWRLISADSCTTFKDRSSLKRVWSSDSLEPVWWRDDFPPWFIRSVTLTFVWTEASVYEDIKTESLSYLWHERWNDCWQTFKKEFELSQPKLRRTSQLVGNIGAQTVNDCF